MIANLAGTGAAAGLASFGWLTPATLCHFRTSALHMHNAPVHDQRCTICGVSIRLSVLRSSSRHSAVPVRAHMNSVM